MTASRTVGFTLKSRNGRSSLLHRLALLIACGLALLFASPSEARSQAPAINPETLNPEGHPAEDYRHAAELFQSGKRDEAVYWLYRGQLRFRVHLLPRPDLSSDAALFTGLNEATGRPINKWAFGDVPALAATLDRVLAWHAENDDSFTPKAEFAAAHAEIRAGLEGLRDRIVAEQESIEAQRRQNGLPNRN